MAKPEFVISDPLPGFRLVKFVIPGGVASPREFAEAVSEISHRLPGPHCLLINGKGTIWGYGMIVHAAHPTRAIGTFDPARGSYVIVQSHVEDMTVGQELPDPYDQLASGSNKE